MIDISGILDFSKEQREISRILSNIAPDPGIPVHIFEISLSSFGAKNLVHSFLNPSAQPFISQDKRFYAFAEGEVYSGANGNTLDSLMQHFLLNGLSGWDKINGQYVFVVYDALEKKLHIINDRFGFRQFYYYRKDNIFIFSSQIKGVTRLLPASADLFPVGMGELVLFGYHIFENTSFESIKSCLPASQLTVSRDGIEINRYWKAIYTPDEHVSPRELAESLKRAVLRQLSGTRKGILLSGGMDSRIVTYESSKRDPSMNAFTFGVRDSMDVQYAELVTHFLGLRHQILEFQAKKWRSYIPMVVAQTEGEAIFHHFKSIQFHSTMKSHCDTLLTGLSGDFIMGSFIVSNNLLKMSEKTIVDFICSKFFEHSMEYVRKILKEEYFSYIIQSIKGSISSSLTSNENEIAADILDAWNIENRQRRFILIGPHSDRYLFNIRSPFYDYDFFDYSLRIPAHLRYEETFYLKALWMAMPELRDIPWQKTGKPPFPDQRTEQYWDMRNRVLSFFGLKKSLPLAGLKKEFVDFSRLLREAFTLEDLLALICDRNYKWHEYFDMAEVRRLIASHMSGQENHYLMICKMMTFSFLETIFIDQKGWLQEKTMGDDPPTR